tara:strand:+ start:101 stop:283 length:183 start_codon:yes stop_codon:yes gene_type:complete
MVAVALKPWPPKLHDVVLVNDGTSGEVVEYKGNNIVIHDHNGSTRILTWLVVKDWATPHV